MYTAYFGLSDAPFTIAPDPAYLFMSDRHREALAHLSYGLGDNGGFVLLTGEVGTGKTTISRSVMEKLPENTQAAFILNPTLSCEELLATICDNFKVRYKKTGATLKYLTDKIQNKLLKNHHDNINTLLIIDEAQHLKPEVLEQLRLLTNLETNTKKLLQVILIGQPELQQLLQRRDLRQLAQRITARYHLLPLTKPELKRYIEHRLSVAQCTRPLFNKAAISMLHRISHGIPRVVNLLCDRALIIAYGKNDTVINSKIVQQSAIEALGQQGEIKHFWQQTPIKVMFVGAMLSLAVFSGYWYGFQQHDVIKPEVVKTPLAKETLIGKTSNREVIQTTPDSKAIVPSTKLDSTLPATSAVKTDVSNESLINEAVTDESITDEQQPRVLGYQPERVKPLFKDETYDIVAKPGVSQDLLARFKEAVNDTQVQDVNVEKGTFETDPALIPKRTLKAVHQMPAWLQNSLPSLQFEMHIYATERQGWVRVNGEDRREGEQIAKGVVLGEILPQEVVLIYQNEQFTMPALSSW